MSAGNCRCVTHASHFKQKYMLEMVEARRTSGEAEERHDLFSGLLGASRGELEDVGALNDEELMGKHPNVVPLCIP